MKNCFLFLLLFTAIQAFGQLGFCEGSKGDAIFHEDFGSGTSTGSPLPSGITNYTFVTGDPYDGQYTISGRIGMDNGTWHSFLPGTSLSGGRALIVNADYTAGRFYRTPISGLCENTTYEFSAYLLNVYDRTSNACENGGIPVNVRFEIWDETDSFLIKKGSTGNIPSTNSPQWNQYGLTFQTAPGQEAVILKMFNEGEGGCGNDLAIDDIIFRSCGDLTLITSPESNGSNFSICEEETPKSLVLYADPDFSVYSEHYFQWQESVDSQNWNDIPGETEDSFTTPGLTTSTYYRVKVAEDAVNLNNNLCSSASEPFFMEIIETPNAPVSKGDVIACENDPLALEVEVQAGETVNWYDAATNGDLVAEGTTSFIPTVAGTYYAEARKDNSCNPGPRTRVNYSISSLPAVQDETLYYCGDELLTLEAGVEDMQYTWNTGETSSTIEIAGPGTYQVTITTNEGCSLEKKIEVMEVPVAGIEEVISAGSTVTISSTNPGLFEYSLDGINFQLSNKFDHMEGGIYTAYVRDLQECNTVNLEFPHIVVPEFITPNGDGYNDYFQLDGIEYFDSSEVKIFDRYGKLLKSGRGENFQWNGKFNNINLPEDDYWYEISIENYPSRKGHFSLMR